MTAIALSKAKMIAVLKFNQQDDGDRTISVTRSPLVAKSCQTKAQAGRTAEESCSNPFQELSAPSYSLCPQEVADRNRYQ